MSDGIASNDVSRASTVSPLSGKGRPKRPNPKKKKLAKKSSKVKASFVAPDLSEDTEVESGKSQDSSINDSASDKIKRKSAQPRKRIRLNRVFDSDEA
jgi:hypothetical protein